MSFLLAYALLAAASQKEREESDTCGWNAMNASRFSSLTFFGSTTQHRNV
jgi:hypothetical protein